MSTRPAPRFVLLAALDASPTGKLVVQQALSLVASIPGAELHLVHVGDRAAEANVTNTPFDLQSKSGILAAAMRQTEAAGVKAFGHLVDDGPVEGILRTAAMLDADLVVVGTRDRHGPERWILGSVAQKVMQRAACPVLVARPKSHAADHAPEIEPPCPDCLEVQRASQGAELWCARHRQHHPRAHLHYQTPEGFGAGSSLIRG